MQGIVTFSFGNMKVTLIILQAVYVSVLMSEKYEIIKYENPLTTKTNEDFNIYCVIMIYINLSKKTKNDARCGIILASTNNININTNEVSLWLVSE